MTESVLTDTLLALESSNSVLFLGPGVAGKPIKIGDRDVVKSQTARLANKLATDGNLGIASPAEVDQLPHVAALFKQKTSELRLFSLVYKFLDDATQASEVYGKLAELPFDFIVNTAPDRFLVSAYQGMGKGFQLRFFHYNLAQGSNAQKNGDLGGELENLTPDRDRPLVINLLGIHKMEKPTGGFEDRTDSIPLTSHDQLDFLEKITARPPTALQSLIKQRKLLIFLGFEFEDWYLRVLFHSIFKFESSKEPQTFALINQKGILAGPTEFFYQNRFKFNFEPTPIEEFVGELRKRWLAENPPASLPKEKPVAGPTVQKPLVVILHDSKDDGILKKFTSRMAVEAQFWSTDDSLGAADWLAATTAQLPRARVIIPLITANFMSNEDLFGLLDQAIALHSTEVGKLKVVPILMQFFAVAGLPLTQLSTFLLFNPMGQSVAKRGEDQALSEISVLLKQLLTQKTD